MAAPPVLVRDLRRSYGEVRALRELSLSIAAGEMYGLVGPDGAGKTTLMRILAGMIGADGGRVEVLGADPLRAPASARARAKSSSSLWGTLPSVPALVIASIPLIQCQN